MGLEYKAATSSSPLLWRVLAETLRDHVNPETMLIDDAKFGAYLSSGSAKIRADIKLKDALVDMAMEEDHVYIVFWGGNLKTNESILADLESAARSATGVSLKFEEI